MDTASGEVDVDGWWSYLERKIIEGIVFKDTEPEKVEALRIAPWIPPACRGHVVNTSVMHANIKALQLLLAVQRHWPA